MPVVVPPRARVLRATCKVARCPAHKAMPKRPAFKAIPKPPPAMPAPPVVPAPPAAPAPPQVILIDDPEPPVPKKDDTELNLGEDAGESPRTSDATPLSTSESDYVPTDRASDLDSEPGFYVDYF